MTPAEFLKRWSARVASTDRETFDAEFRIMVDRFLEWNMKPSEAAARLGRRGGRLGGIRRRDALTPERRAEIARIAGKARWQREPGGASADRKEPTP